MQSVCTKRDSFLHVGACCKSLVSRVLPKVCQMVEITRCEIGLIERLQIFLKGHLTDCTVSHSRRQSWRRFLLSVPKHDDVVLLFFYLLQLPAHGTVQPGKIVIGLKSPGVLYVVMTTDRRKVIFLKRLSSRCSSRNITHIYTHPSGRMHWISQFDAQRSEVFRKFRVRILLWGGHISWMTFFVVSLVSTLTPG